MLVPDELLDDLINRYERATGVRIDRAAATDMARRLLNFYNATTRHAQNASPEEPEAPEQTAPEAA